MKLKHLLLTSLGIIFCMTGLAQIPVANFSISPNPVCSGAIYTVQITDMSTNAPTSWSYTMTGAAPATSTLQNPMINYPNPGTFSITLVAKNGTGSSLPVVKTVTVLASPNALINPVVQNMCAGGGPVLFTDMVLGPGIYTYSWNTGATTASISVSPSVTTSYTCAVTNTIGCTTVRTCTANVNPLPSVTVAANPTVICGPSTSTMTAFVTGASPFTYSWSAGGTASTAVTPVPGNFSVTVTDVNNCKSTKTITIVNGTIPTLTVNANPGAICTGANSTLTTLGTCTSFTWNPGALTGPSVTVSPGGTTTYTVVGYNGQCTRTVVKTLTVSPSSTVMAVTSSSLLCAGQSATLNATAVGPAIPNYTWSTGTVSTTIVVSPSVTTSYTVGGNNVAGCYSQTVIIQNVSPCLGVNSLSNQVTEFGVYPNPNNGEFTISTKQISENTCVEIYNGLGQLINHSQLKETNHKINLAKEAVGVYHIRIIQDGKPVYRTKILVN